MLEVEQTKIKQEMDRVEELIDEIILAGAAEDLHGDAAKKALKDIAVNAKIYRAMSVKQFIELHGISKVVGMQNNLMLITLIVFAVWLFTR